MPRAVQGAVCETEISAQSEAVSLSKRDPGLNAGLEGAFPCHKHPFDCFSGDGESPPSCLGFPLLSLGQPAT